MSSVAYNFYGHVKLLTDFYGQMILDDIDSYQQYVEYINSICRTYLIIWIRLLHVMLYVVKKCLWFQFWTVFKSLIVFLCNIFNKFLIHLVNRFAIYKLRTGSTNVEQWYRLLIVIQILKWYAVIQTSSCDVKYVNIIN